MSENICDYCDESSKSVVWVCDSCMDERYQDQSSEIEKLRTQLSEAVSALETIATKQRLTKNTTPFSRNLQSIARNTLAKIKEGK